MTAPPVPSSARAVCAPQPMTATPGRAPANR